MCTVTWQYGRDGYEIFCNRDEKRTRGVARPPEVHTRDGVSILAPVDADHRGTWIGVNEFAVALCLVNGRPAAGPGRVSRGLLLMDLLSSASQMDVLVRLSRIDLAQYAAFTICAFEPGLSVAAAAWDGRELAILPNADRLMPIASSSFDPDGIAERRAAQWSLFGGSGAPLTDFHGSHVDGPSAWSPCMHRADAETVSFSKIRVDDYEAAFTYTAGSPCQNRTAHTQFLPLHASVPCLA